MEKDLKFDIKQAVMSQGQTNMFGAPDDAGLEEACAAFLRYKGYKVTKPINFKYNIQSTDDLIKFFYTMLDAKHPEYVNVYRNLGRDRKIAVKFIKNRMDTTGNSKEISLKECASIIDTVFVHEKEFKFRTDIYFGMFGQANLSWVTRKALEIINKGAEDARRESSRKEIERIEREQQQEYNLGFNDIDSILERIEEEEDGKEKGN